MVNLRGNDSQVQCTYGSSTYKMRNEFFLRNTPSLNRRITDHIRNNFLKIRKYVRTYGTYKNGTILEHTTGTGTVLYGPVASASTIPSKNLFSTL